MNALAHDIDCTHPDIEYVSSGCSDFCDYRKQATRDCVEEGEHFKRTISESGYDVCFNCGGRS